MFRQIPFQLTAHLLKSDATKLLVTFLFHSLYRWFLNIRMIPEAKVMNHNAFAHEWLHDLMTRLFHNSHIF